MPKPTVRPANTSYRGALRQSDANSNSDTHCYCHSDCHSYTYGNSNTYSPTHANAKV